MSGPSLSTEHPVDLLPEYARGDAPNAVDIERHLAECESCRLEVDLLRALGAPVDPPLSDVEIERVYRGFEAARTAACPAGGSSGPAWLRTAWKVAAGIALLLTSVGVVEIVQADRSDDWDPEAALEGLERDLAGLELSPGDVRLALGEGLVGDPMLGLPLGSLEDMETGDVAVPWEVER